MLIQSCDTEVDCHTLRRLEARTGRSIADPRQTAELSLAFVGPRQIRCELSGGAPDLGPRRANPLVHSFWCRAPMDRRRSRGLEPYTVRTAVRIRWER